MKFQDSGFYGLKVTVGTKTVTHLLRVPTHTEKIKRFFFHKTTSTYRCTFFLCYYLPKLCNNIYSLKF